MKLWIVTKTLIRIQVVNERSQKDFVVTRQTETPYGFIKEDTFDLNPNFALGNILKVFAQTSRGQLSLGDCSIVLRDPNLNETQYVIDHYVYPSEKGNNLKVIIVCSVLAVLAIIVIALIYRYRKNQRRAYGVDSSSDNVRMISGGTPASTGARRVPVDSRSDLDPGSTPKQGGGRNKGGDRESSNEFPVGFDEEA